MRGFCIASPSGNRVDEFIKFIEEELAPRVVNTLILRVDYNFQFLSRTEMADKGGLSREQAQSIAAICRKHQIRVIPLIDLLGHQSWQANCGKLLKVYPEFDETPEVKFPGKYAWPNADRLYQMKLHFQGVVQTIWSGAGGFLDQYYGRKPANDQKPPGHTESNCFRRMSEAIANPK